ncbi:unnamed protein product [Citrullus colocynthis]|uniref:Uncharacterized protein n=1 Tax=Citrullus colocynthis TaxID=252529 RepID=A0ABP0YDR0_9ROSI
MSTQNSEARKRGRERKKCGILWKFRDGFVSELIMGGCFPCFGSSDEDGDGVKEATKKDSAKDGSTAQSHHVRRSYGSLNSGNFLVVHPVFVADRIEWRLVVVGAFLFELGLCSWDPSCLCAVLLTSSLCSLW